MTILIIQDTRYKLNTKTRKLTIFLLLGPVIWTCCGLIYFFKYKG